MECVVHWDMVMIPIPTKEKQFLDLIRSMHWKGTDQDPCMTLIQTPTILDGETILISPILHFPKS